MELHRFGPDDLDDVRAYVEVQNAVRAADSPWEHPLTEHEAVGLLRHGWDGEPDDPVPRDGRRQGRRRRRVLHLASGTTIHLAGVEVAVHPAHRRQGHGSAMLEAMVERARSEGRTTIGIGWLGRPRRRGVRGPARPRAEVGGRHPAAVPAELDRDLLARLFDEALPHAAAYELVRLAGRSAEDELSRRWPR